MSVREVDHNHWWNIKKNPITKVGIYKYTGAEINAVTPLGLDENKIYSVFRSPEALSDPTFLQSLDKLPIINNHVPLLGRPEFGGIPAEEKGVEGVMGEQNIFDEKSGTVFSNIKIFSESLFNAIQSLKDQLSLGYDCAYRLVSGIFDGQSYDLVQENLLGNHLALVQNGRMGKDVRVLDQAGKFILTIDSAQEIEKMAGKTKKVNPKKAEVIAATDAAIATLKTSIDSAIQKATDADAAAEPDKKDPTISELSTILEGVMPALTKIMDMVKGIMGEPDGDEIESDGTMAMTGDKAIQETLTKLQTTVDAQNEVIAKQEASLLKIQEDQKGGIKTIMKAVTARDALHNKVSPYTGVIDCSTMTVDELAEKSVETLKIPCEKGQELAALNGFLHAQSNLRTPTFVMDSASTASDDEFVKKYLKKSA